MCLGRPPWESLKWTSEVLARAGEGGAPQLLTVFDHPSWAFLSVLLSFLKYFFPHEVVSNSPRQKHGLLFVF